MRAELMEFCGLTRSPRAVAYYETAYDRQLLQDIKQAVYDGDLVALCGVVGVGKTVTLRRLREMLARENRVIVSKSIAVEKSRVTLGRLITVLFNDLLPTRNRRSTSRASCASGNCAIGSASAGSQLCRWSTKGMTCIITR